MNKAWRWVLVLGAHAGIVGLLAINHGCRTPPPSRAAAPETAVIPPPPPPPERPAPPAPPPPPPQWPSEAATYVVQPGDSLGKIAARHGVTVTEIATLNGIRNPNLIRPGQKLKIPAKPTVEGPKRTPEKPSAPSAVAPAAGSTYQVQPGDTLSAIAHRAGVTVSELREANGLTSDRILVGQKLIIPEPRKGAKPSTGQPPQAARPTSSPVAPTAPTLTLPPAPPPVPPPAGTSSPTSPVPRILEPASAPPPAAPPSPSASAPSAGSQAFRTYVVQEDEDLYSIAMMWNVSPERLKEVNGLSSMTVKPGDRLKIPVSD